MFFLAIIKMDINGADETVEKCIFFFKLQKKNVLSLQQLMGFR